ncbi:hypothetical protein M8C21_004646, partial [Ambrosia artemisiifolia]
PIMFFLLALINIHGGSFKSLPVLPRATIAISTTQDNDFVFANHGQRLVISSERDVSNRIDKLKENTRRALMTASNPTMTMRLVDMIQRLGLGYSFEEEIKVILATLPNGQPDDDLYTVALRFRILRQNDLHPNPGISSKFNYFYLGFVTFVKCRASGIKVLEKVSVESILEEKNGVDLEIESEINFGQFVEYAATVKRFLGEPKHSDTNVFGPFMDANGKFLESLDEDIEGLLSLYEASYIGTNGEDVLSQAKEFTTTHLRKSVSSRLTNKLREQILQNFAIVDKWVWDFSFLLGWWRDLGLASKLTFARDRPHECFLWTVGLLPEPKYSTIRIELAKTISILLVIDDIFDTYGAYDDLILFTKAIQRYDQFLLNHLNAERLNINVTIILLYVRWDLDEMEQLPEYMKICYMALYNTTNDICHVVHKNHGLSALPYLKKAWFDTIQAFMVEAEWVSRGNGPNLKDYIENGITTAGTYMALVHLFFLIGEGVTAENTSYLLHSYPRFFTDAGKILRLWDDLGTSKEEQERGDIASSVQLLMRENNITSEEDGRKQILQLIQISWNELNEALVAPNIFPLSIITVALNMSRASQVVYQHDGN